MTIPRGRTGRTPYPAPKSMQDIADRIRRNEKTYTKTSLTKAEADLITRLWPEDVRAQDEKDYDMDRYAK